MHKVDKTLYNRSSTLVQLKNVKKIVTKNNYAMMLVRKMSIINSMLIMFVAMCSLSCIIHKLCYNYYYAR